MTYILVKITETAVPIIFSINPDRRNREASYALNGERVVKPYQKEIADYKIDQGKILGTMTMQRILGSAIFSAEWICRSLTPRLKSNIHLILSLSSNFQRAFFLGGPRFHLHRQSLRRRYSEKSLHSSKKNPKY